MPCAPSSSHHHFDRWDFFTIPSHGWFMTLFEPHDRTFITPSSELSSHQRRMRRFGAENHLRRARDPREVLRPFQVGFGLLRGGG